ncbi:unnamed protein product [Pichia kudriavzevii]
MSVANNHMVPLSDIADWVDTLSFGLVHRIRKKTHPTQNSVQTVSNSLKSSKKLHSSKDASLKRRNTTCGDPSRKHKGSMVMDPLSSSGISDTITAAPLGVKRSHTLDSSRPARSLSAPLFTSSHDKKLTKKSSLIFSHQKAVRAISSPRAKTPNSTRSNSVESKDSERTINSNTTVVPIKPLKRVTIVDTPTDLITGDNIDSAVSPTPLVEQPNDGIVDTKSETSSVFSVEPRFRLVVDDHITA